MTVMTVNFGKPIKTNNYLERVVTFLLHAEPQPLQLQSAVSGVLASIDFLMLYPKSNYQHLIVGYEDVSGNIQGLFSLECIINLNLIRRGKQVHPSAGVGWGENFWPMSKIFGKI